MILETAKAIMAKDDGQAFYEEIAEMAIRRHGLLVTAQSFAELVSALRADDKMARKNAIIPKPKPLTRFEAVRLENVAKARTFLAQTAALSRQDRTNAFFALPDGVRSAMSDLLTRTQRKEML